MNYEAVHLSGVELYDSKLFVVGRDPGYDYDSRKTESLQIFDLSTNTCHTLEAKILLDKISTNVLSENVNVF